MRAGPGSSRWWGTIDVRGWRYGVLRDGTINAAPVGPSHRIVADHATRSTLARVEPSMIHARNCRYFTDWATGESFRVILRPLARAGWSGSVPAPSDGRVRDHQR